MTTTSTAPGSQGTVSVTGSGPWRILLAIGSLVGPVLGAVLVAVPFATTCLVAAGLFGVILLAQLVWLPPGARIGDPRSVAASLRLVLANRPFLAFAALHSTYLLSYTQLYLAAPVELRRIGAPRFAAR